MRAPLTKWDCVTRSYRTGGSCNPGCQLCPSPQQGGRLSAARERWKCSATLPPLISRGLAQGPPLAVPPRPRLSERPRPQTTFPGVPRGPGPYRVRGGGGSGVGRARVEVPVRRSVSAAPSAGGAPGRSCPHGPRGRPGPCLGLQAPAANVARSCGPGGGDPVVAGLGEELFVEAGAARGAEAAPGNPARAEGEPRAGGAGPSCPSRADLGRGGGRGPGARSGLAGALRGAGSPLSSGRSAVPAAPRAWAVAVGSPSELQQRTCPVPAAPGGSRSLGEMRGTLRCLRLCESQRSHLT